MSIMVKEVLNMAEAALTKAGCPDPKLDAERLLQFQHHLDSMGLFLMKSKMMDQKDFEEYFKLVDFRLTGMPFQYITGSQEFMGLEFKVNQHVLIPRQDTETLVETALEYLKGEDSDRRLKHKGDWKILDLCCGSGAIGISLARLASEAEQKLKVTAADLSEEALKVARENASRLGIDKKMTFVSGDLFQPFKKRLGKTRFHMILSNPPYIPSEVIPTLQTEVRDHEPRMALDGGPDGLDFYRRILTEARDHLEKGGILLLEIGYDQGKALEQIYDSIPGYSGFRLIQDLAGQDRVVVIYG